IVDPAEPDLGNCSGKAGDLGRALARDITSPLPSGGAPAALRLGPYYGLSQGCNGARPFCVSFLLNQNLAAFPTPSTLPGSGVDTLYIPSLLAFVVYNRGRLFVI
ncbi:hypothetical protein CKAH01_19176, partial [Colletotrichum kahawae]